MKYFDWDEDKNNKLKKTRDVSFEEIVLAISNNQILDILVHTNKEKYPNQKMFVIELFNYAYLVPFVEDKEKYFLKTIYPSRDATKKYLNK
jgi:uncharacterized DUF497 family protein